MHERSLASTPIFLWRPLPGRQRRWTGARCGVGALRFYGSTRAKTNIQPRTLFHVRAQFGVSAHVFYGARSMGVSDVRHERVVA